MTRTGVVERKTRETDIFVEIGLDGNGAGEIVTTIPFLDHMLMLMAKHGFMDITVRGSGDTDVDYHHLVEDLGICLGEAMGQAVGDKRGIRRYGAALIPMDESLASVAVDLSGRSCLVFNADFKGKKIRDFDPLLFKEFFKALVDNGGITLHINMVYGTNPHHMAESIFKAFARAFSEAVSIDDRVEGVMSTKGSL